MLLCMQCYFTHVNVSKRAMDLSRFLNMYHGITKLIGRYFACIYMLHLKAVLQSDVIMESFCLLSVQHFYDFIT